jgi:hypothetical protein
MPTKKAKQHTTVTVNQVSTVELTKRGSKNSLLLEVRTGNDLLGTLVLGQGSVQWWPKGNSAKKFQKSWRAFTTLLDNSIGK